MLAFAGVSKSRGRHFRLGPLDLRLATGVTHALVGPSGCGKSTLLRLACGLVWPDAGRVEVAGHHLQRKTIRTTRRGLGFVLQEGGLFPHLKARDNVELVARHLGWPRERIETRVAELRALTGLSEGVLDRYPLQLSGGQRQRVSLMRALMLDPPLLLMDEPLGALDPMIRAELQDQLKGLFRALEKTVLLVTHDLAEAAHLAETILLMSEGSLVQTGTLHELEHAPRNDFVEAFISAQRRLHGGLEGGS